MLGVNKVLVESYRLIYRFIHHGGKIWMNSAIQKRVRWLYRNYRHHPMGNHRHTSSGNSNAKTNIENSIQRNRVWKPTS
jgi:hypothetical protein